MAGQGSDPTNGIVAESTNGETAVGTATVSRAARATCSMGMETWPMVALTSMTATRTANATALQRLARVRTRITTTVFALDKYLLR